MNYEIHYWLYLDTYNTLLGFRKDSGFGFDIQMNKTMHNVGAYLRFNWNYHISSPYSAQT